MRAIIRQPGFYISLLLAGYFIYLLSLSMDWPIMHDAPLMHYLASRFLQGEVPYRDYFDFNFPGSYLLHMICLKVFGYSDLGWRLFDVFMLLPAWAGMYLLSGRQKWISLAGVSGFAVYHILWGMPSVGQRDYFMVCILLFSAGLISHSFSSAKRRRTKLLTAGFFFAWALFIKPTALLLLVIWAVILLVGLNRQLRTYARFCVPFLAGILIFSLPMMVWMMASGAWGYFLDIMFNYVASFHSRDEARTYQELILFLLKTLWPLWIITVTCIVVYITGKRGVISLPLVLAGIAFGIFHFLTQRKGWDYHLYPLAGFLFALPCSLRIHHHIREKWILPGLSLLAAAWFIPLAWKGVTHAGEVKEYKDYVRTKSLVAWFRSQQVPPGTRIQVFDTVGGGINVLYRLQARSATRFFYDFVFLHHGAYMDKIKGEFMTTLTNSPPPYMIFYHNGWLPPDLLSERIGMVPGLAEFIESHYRECFKVDERVFVYCLR